MEPIEIIVIVASVLIVLGVITFSIIRKIKNKKSGCVGGCCGCAYSASCSKSHTDSEDKM